MGYVAKVNFDAGKGLLFQQGQVVAVSDEALTSRLLSEGLIVVVKEETVVEPKQEVVQTSDVAKEEKPSKKKKG